MPYAPYSGSTTAVPTSPIDSVPCSAHESRLDSPPYLNRPCISSSSVMSTSIEPKAATSTQASESSSLKEAVDAAGIFPRNGPDPSARSWGHHSSGVTFAAQHKLPKLPLPSLESSCKRYLEALKPLQSALEHNASAAAVQNFLHEEGPILQAQLKEYDKSHANYFEHFCEFHFLPVGVTQPDPATNL